jgi:hypothetical protein
MTIVYATDEMKKDVESLISIAREDNIEAEKVYLIYLIYFTSLDLGFPVNLLRSI